MKIKKSKLLKVVSGLVCSCCLFTITCSEGTAPTALDKTNMVISGFLYSGEPVSDIRVVNATPAGTQDSTVIVFDSTLNDFDTIRFMPVNPINSAEVSLYVDGKKYALASLDDAGYYGDLNNSIIIKSGVTYRLEAKYLGKTATAETVAPEAAANLTVSRDTIFQASGGGGGGKNNNQTTNTQLDESLQTAKFKWANPTNEPYYVMLQQTEVAINPKNPNGGGINRGTGYFTREDTIIISSIRANNDKKNRNVTALMANKPGTWEVKIYRVNRDYRDLDQFIGQQEKAEKDGMGFLEEPPSNVKGGLGIFAAFTASVRIIYVVKEQGEPKPEKTEAESKSEQPVAE